MQFLVSTLINICQSTRLMQCLCQFVLVSVIITLSPHTLRQRMWNMKVVFWHHTQYFIQYIWDIETWERHPIPPTCKCWISSWWWAQTFEHWCFLQYSCTKCHQIYIFFFYILLNQSNSLKQVGNFGNTYESWIMTPTEDWNTLCVKCIAYDV